MERTWTGPQPLMAPAFLAPAGSTKSRRAALPPINTSIAAQVYKDTPRVYLPSESPDSMQSTPYPSPSTALTTPPIDSPTMYKAGRYERQEHWKMEEDIRDLRQQVDALKARVQELRRSGKVWAGRYLEAVNRKNSEKVWTGRYLEEVTRNRQEEEQLHENIHGLSTAED